MAAKGPYTGTNAGLLPLASTGNSDKLLALLAEGAPWEASDPYLRAATYLAATHGHAGCLQACLQAGADAEAFPAFTDYTPFLAAARGGHGACMRALLAAGCDKEAVGPRGLTALHECALGALGAPAAPRRMPPPAALPLSRRAT